MDRKGRTGLVLAFSAAVVWGFLGPVVREMSRVGYSSMQMTCLRYLVVFVVLGIFMLSRDRSLYRVDKRMLVLLALLGIIGNALNSSFYFSAMERISLSLSTILQYFSPFLVVLASVSMFGERLTHQKLAAVCVAFLGCVLCTGLLTDPGSMDTLGILLGAVSSFFFAFYTLGSKKAKNGGVPTITILFYSGLFCSLFLMPICDMPSAVSTVTASGYNLFLLLLLGLALTLLPFGLYNMALERAEAGKVAVVTYIEPVTSTLVGLAFYGEDVTPEIFIGIVLVLLALIIVNRKQVAD